MDRFGRKSALLVLYAGFTAGTFLCAAATGYSGHVTFEYFHPFLHYPEALIHQTSDSLDRILGRKA